MELQESFTKEVCTPLAKGCSSVAQFVMEYV
jgi:hypothetical protein